MSAARALLLAGSAWLALAAGARAQDAAFRELPLRVVAQRGRELVIDRGTRDRLEPGDELRLDPREGPPRRGLVRRVQERRADVELLDGGAPPPVGTPGVVFVPAERFAPQEQAPPPAPPERPPWARDDAEHTPDQPLLAGVEVLRPEERPVRVGGRVYFTNQSVLYSEDDRADRFTRAGFDVFWENPFGRGGVLEFDGELNDRVAELPDLDGEERTKGRLDRLSYAWGGTRFAPDRHQVGRFLQPELPELGVLDGYAWSRRVSEHHSVGASVGYLPEPDKDQETGEDFQLAGWYRWASDDSERFTATAAYQKTWHDGSPDRDLLVGRLQLLPREGWTVHTTAWVDLYDDDDTAKGSGADLTWLIASAVRTYDGGHGQAWTYTHRELPELEREEFPPVTAAELADDRVDRLAWDGWLQWTQDTRVFAEAGVWDDEDESGGDLELGMDVDGVLRPGGRGHLSGFVTSGAFSEGVGGRVGYAWAVEGGAWDASYEVARFESLGFEDADFAETVQHALRLSRDVFLDDGWDLRGTLEARRWDEETAWSLGVYLQKRF